MVELTISPESEKILVQTDLHRGANAGVLLPVIVDLFDVDNEQEVSVRVNVEFTWFNRLRQQRVKETSPVGNELYMLLVEAKNWLGHREFGPEDEDPLEDLRLRAKELGVPNYWSRGEESLLEKIAEAEAALVAEGDDEEE